MHSLSWGAVGTGKPVRVGSAVGTGNAVHIAGDVGIEGAVRGVAVNTGYTMYGIIENPSSTN